MRKKQALKIMVDMAMLILLFLLMSRHITGNLPHEWLGMGIFSLFIIHHVLNISWWKHIGKGHYSLFRKVQTALDMLILADMLAMMISSILCSQYVFSSLHIGGTMLGRTIHLAGSYWGFVFLAFHLGLHFPMFAGMARKRFGTEKYAVIGKVFRLLFFLAALYGVVAFIQRDLWRYMFLLTHFAFFDYEEPIVFFLLDYLAIAITFAFIGSRIAEWVVRPMPEKKM